MTPYFNIKCSEYKEKSKIIFVLILQDFIRLKYENIIYNKTTFSECQ